MLHVLPAHAQPLRACCLHCCCSSVAVLSSSLGQLPGTASLAQVLSGSILQHARGLAAQAARAMEQPAFQHPEAADARQGAPAAPQPCAAPPAAPAPVSPKVPEVPRAATAAAVVQAHQPPSPTGVKKTFYKRKLPCPPATEFSSTDGAPLAAAARICRSQECQQAAVLWHDLCVPPSLLLTSAALRLLLLVAGRLLFAEALQQGTMSGFFKLIEQYRCVCSSLTVIHLSHAPAAGAGPATAAATAVAAAAVAAALDMG